MAKDNLTVCDPLCRSQCSGRIRPTKWIRPYCSVVATLVVSLLRWKLIKSRVRPEYANYIYLSNQINLHLREKKAAANVLFNMDKLMAIGAKKLTKETN